MAITGLDRVSIETHRCHLRVAVQHPFLPRHAQCLRYGRSV